MIPVEKFSPVRLRQLPVGEVFFPLRSNDEMFVAGRANQYELLMVLEGPEPFHIAEREEWTRGTGFTLQGASFEVDQKTRKSLADGTEEIGELIIDEDGFGIVGQSRHNRIMVWYLVSPIQSARTRLPSLSGRS